MINITKFNILNILSFLGSNCILSLITFWTNIEPYDIWYGYICNFDKFDRNGMYSSTTTSTIEQSIYLFMCFRIFNFGQIKIIFCQDENFKELLIASINVYRYSNLIKTDNYLEQTAVLI